MSDEIRPRPDLDFAKAAGELAAATRCTDVVLLDVSGRSQVAHYFLIATGTSPRQMNTVADQIAELGEQMGFKPWRVSGAESAKWILIDCVDVIVHLFDAPSRAFYDLELLWGDCPRMELNLPGTSAAPQTDETEAALEAVQEVIEAAMEVDDELALMELGQVQTPPSTDASGSAADGELGTITGPPDDQAIRYESISIEVTSEEGSNGSAAAASPSESAGKTRRRPSAKKRPGKAAAAAPGRGTRSRTPTRAGRSASSSRARPGRPAKKSKTAPAKKKPTSRAGAARSKSSTGRSKSTARKLGPSPSRTRAVKPPQAGKGKPSGVKAARARVSRTASKKRK
jgi:ribosome-associated protein